MEQNDFEGFLFEELKTTSHFKIPLYSLRIFQSTIIVIHKALPYKPTCSVDHFKSQATLICRSVGG